jgi:hypothetical protein
MHLGCADTARRVVRQEHQDSGVTLPAIEHRNNSDFVINLFALHNYNLIANLVESHLGGYLNSPVESPSRYEEIRNQAARRVREPKQESASKEATSMPCATFVFL